MKNSAPSEKGKGRTRLVLVDSHPMLRRGLCHVLDEEPHFEVAGEAESAARAFTLLKSVRPHVLVTELSLPDRSGLDFIKDLRVQFPTVHILVYSASDESVHAERALRAGSKGYLMKTESVVRFVEALKRVASGNIYLSERMADRVLTNFSKGARRSSSPLAPLSDREFDVFQLIGQGFTTQEISRRLHLSPKTVETHRLHIREKLNLHSRQEMIKHAVQLSGTHA